MGVCQRIGGNPYEIMLEEPEEEDVEGGPRWI